MGTKLGKPWRKLGGCSRGMTKRFISFTNKLTFLVMVLSLIPVILTSTYLYYSEIENETETLVNRLESLSGIGAANVGLWIEEKKIAVESIARNGAIIAETKELLSPELGEDNWFNARFNLHTDLSTSIHQYDWLEELIISEPNTGEVVFTTGDSSFPDGLKTEQHFQDAINKKVGVSQVFPSKTPIKNEYGQYEIGVPTLLISVPIHSEVGIEGVLSARVNIFLINPAVKNYLTDFVTADLYLVNSDGYFLSGSAFPETLHEMGLIEKRAELELLLKVPDTGQFTKIFQEKNPNETISILKGYDDYRGIPVVGAVTVVPGTDWGYIVEVDEKEAYQEIALLQFWLFIAIGGLIIITSIMVVVSTNRLVYPIKSLTKTVSEIHEETSKFEVDPKIMKSNDEITVLAKTIQNQMTKIQNDTKQLLEFKIALDEAAIVSIGDTNDKIIFVNEQFCKSSKYSREELLEQNLKIVNSGHHTREFFKEMKNTLTSGKTWRGEIKNKAKDGSFYWLKSVIIPVLNEEKEVTSYITVSTNITEEKRKEESFVQSDKEKSKTIEIQLEELKSVEKQKDEFVAMITHELKTPLTPIIGFSEALMNPKLLEELTPKQLDAVEIILKNANRLHSIIGDLLDSHRLDLGKIKFNYTKVDVVDLTNSVIKNFKKEIESKKIQFIVDATPPMLITTDKQRVEQVLTNIVANSMDFVSMDTGKISVSAKLQKDHVLFTIQDNGVGISPEDIDSIFDSFSQIDTKLTRKHGGAGLGLAICRSLVTRLGGKIWVESELGKVTSFYFTIAQNAEQMDKSE